MFSEVEIMIPLQILICGDCKDCVKTTKRGYDGFCQKKGHYCHKSDNACKDGTGHDGINANNRAFYQQRKVKV